MTATDGSGGSPEERDELLELLLADEGIELAAKGITPRDASQPAVLSYAQERMWLVDQLEGDDSALVISGSVALQGPLNVDALERSLAEIIRRHDVLRTVIVMDGGHPRPEVLPIGAAPLRFVDVDGDQEQLNTILQDESGRRFDMASEAPISVVLVRVADDHHVLSIRMHHVASDGSSFDLFSREMRALYTAYVDGKPSPLPSLAIQYEDYAAWQQHEASDVFERQLTYWREQLAGPVPIFEIPTDHARPAHHTFDGASVSVQLQPEVVAKLETLCDQSGSTMFMALLAAFEVVASRHAGETDVVIGTPIAGRVRIELEPMIGAFLNTLVIRNDLSDRPTFRTLLDQVRTTCLGAYANQDVPFEVLLADLQPPRDLSRTPLFQIFFNMTHLDRAMMSNALPGIDAEQLEPTGVVANFDLTMYVNETVDGVDARLVYNRGLYDADHMEHFVTQYQHVLAHVADDADVCIDDIRLVNETEIEALPDVTALLDAEWHGSVPQAVRNIAALTPDRNCVVDGPSSLDYAGVATRMDRVATWLRRRGIGHGDVVALHAHRTGSLVWTIAGVLASGASYVVLDSRYPPSRLAQLVRIAEPAAWLELGTACAPEIVEALDEGGVEHRLNMQDTADISQLDALLSLSATDVDGGGEHAEIGPDDPACLTFTSGSTGEPKAVVGRHGSLTHFLPWMSAEFEIDADDRFSMLSGLSHDPLQRDLFWPLSIGAAIVVPDPDQMASPGYIAQWIQHEQVSVVHLTPAMGQLLTEHARVGTQDATEITSLRVALFIGDALTRTQVAELRALAPNVQAVNLYGTTETQRASSYHVVDLDAPTPPGVRLKEVLPLGRGMPGAQLLVHGGTGLPAAVGEVGEVVMRSPHLALGYHNDSDLTLARFDSDPHGAAQGQLYATGDRGRYRVDGSVEFLGRNDDQIQLRGFRIELAEVAAALRLEPGVADAVVDLRADSSGQQRLVAYVIALGDLDATALTQSLRSTLPGHMVPSTITAIDRIPLTPNGKLDRRALPDPIAMGTTPGDSISPRNEMERTLVDIWEQVLGRDDIGIDDDFFALGGYSLLATRVLAFVEDATGMRLPIAELFEHPTVRDLAERVHDGSWRSAVPAITATSDVAATMSYAQERMWFIDQFEHERSALAVGTVLAVHGTLNVTALRRSLDAIYNRHDVLRTLIVSESGDPRPETLPTGRMPFEFHDADGDLDAAERFRSELAGHTFDLASKPPIFVGVVRVTDDHHLLSVLMHHVASDASSLGVFFHELQSLYVSEVNETSTDLEPLGIQYADYGYWQRHQASEIFEEQLDYWRGQLAGPLPGFEIPPDFRRPENHNLSGGRLVGHVPSDVSAGLAELAAQNGATLFMTLLAGFEIVLARHADQTDVMIGTPVAGRVRPELEPLIGAFINTIVLRTDLSGRPSVRTVVERVRDTSLAAFDHQDVPFELLLNELRVARDLSRSPLFQIFFNMTHHDVASTLALPGFQTEILDQSDRGSKFDLTMYANHGEDGTDLALVYNSTLFDQSRMEFLLEQYLQVLAEMVAAPDRCIDDLSLVTSADLAVAPDASIDLDDTWHGSVPDAVRRMAARDGDRVAISDGSEIWDYRLLNTQMSRLASWFLAHGIGTGDVVGILAQRSGSLLPAVTGALACGATYVLLDPSYPAERLATQVRIARPTAWIALEAAGEQPELVTLELDELGVEHRVTLPRGAELAGFVSALSVSDGFDPSIVDAAIDAIRPDDPACLTFTSGSTGEPKAVLGRHGSLTHFLPWMSEEFDVGEDDRFSMLSGLSHDPLQRDMFWPLSLGARIVVPDPESIGTAGWIARWLSDEGVTVAHLTPAMGQLLTESGPASSEPEVSISSLRRALFIGDALTRTDVDRLRERAPSVVVVNLYGTTETQRASGYHVAAGNDAVPHGAEPLHVFPLGRGMPGTQLLIRTANGGPAAVGEIGEIAMRSPHLAIGYHGDAAMTRDRFELDPCGDSSHDQIYATGDRGRYRADGSVEFLGRNDDQVELRGFRIEMGEITTALRRHRSIAEAVAHIWDGEEDDVPARLVAYVRSADGESIDTSDLVRSLRTSLPAHMVPSNVIQIDRIPLTPNGKLDRAALPGPAPDVTITDDGPGDSLERMLIDVWQKVLGRQHVGVHDDFFALGGYSLLATRLFAMVEERTGKQLPLSVLFEHPTISELANAMRDDGWQPTWSSLVPIQPAGTRQPFYYVSAFLMSVLELAPLGEELGDDQPLYGLQPLGLDGSVPPHTSVEDMAAHYISEIKAIQPEGPYSLGGHCAGSWVAFEMARQLEANGEEADALVLVDQGPPGFQRAVVKSPSYIWGRVRFYFSGGRLRHALAWSLKIAVDRFLLRRAGSTASRIEGEVKEAHRTAHRAYDGGLIQRDLTLVLSADSITLSDKAWFTLWSDHTAGGLTSSVVGGTHALMLVHPHVADLAATIGAVLDTRNNETDGR